MLNVYNMNNLIQLQGIFLSAMVDLNQSQKQSQHIIEQKYDSKAALIAGLTYRTINKPQDSSFKEVYQLYETFFPLPEERESFEGFEQTIALNNSIYQNMFGPLQEEWLVVYASDGCLLGGVNFSYYFVEADGIQVKNSFVSVQIMYLFVKAEYRSMGIASTLLDKISQQIQNWVVCQYFDVPEDRIFFFCEQNAPEVMSVSDYFTDAIHALIDPCDRLLWWHKRGYRRLVVNYIQPALNVDSQPCTALTLNIQSSQKYIEGYVIAEHLRRYFTISVLKGKSLDADDPYLTRLFNYLYNNSIAIEGTEAYYTCLKSIFYAETLNDIPQQSQLYTIP